MTAITITFGDQAENHVGMQKLGSAASAGLSVQDLRCIARKIRQSAGSVRFYRLDDLTGHNIENEEIAGLIESQEAAILVISNFYSAAEVEELSKEMTDLEWDTKAWMKGKVVNKKARYNLCFGQDNQEPDYEEKRGRIVAFDDLPLLSSVRDDIYDLLANVFDESLVAEGNLYHDPKCGIGYHGDAERKLVVALRLGTVSSPLRFVWYYKSKPVSDYIEIPLKVGDLYIMSEKATGRDWLKRNIPTLRHATGHSSFTEIKEKKKK